MVFILSLISFHSVLMNKQISRIRVLIVLRFIGPCFLLTNLFETEQKRCDGNFPKCIVSIPITFPCPCIFVIKLKLKIIKIICTTDAINVQNLWFILHFLPAKIRWKTWTKLLELAGHTQSTKILVRWRGGQAWTCGLGEYSAYDDASMSKKRCFSSTLWKEATTH